MRGLVASGVSLYSKVFDRNVGQLSKYSKFESAHGETSWSIALSLKAYSLSAKS